MFQQIQHLPYGDLDLILCCPALTGLRYCTSVIRYAQIRLWFSLAGYGDVQLEQLAAQRGAYAFLHKPVDPEPSSLS